MLTLTRLRTRLLVLLHLALFTSAHFLAYAIRFDFDVPEQYWMLCLGTLPIGLGVKLVSFYVFQLYRSWLRYVSLGDLKRILLAAVTAELLLAVLDRFAYLTPGIPRSVFLLDLGLTIALVAGVMIAARMVRESGLPLIVRNSLSRIFIVGAGDAGEGLLRELRRRPELKYVIVGFLDDDPRKLGARIGGVPVLGKIEEAKALAKAYDVLDAVIAVPSASGRRMREIVGHLRDAGLSFKTLPGVAQIVGGRVDIAQIQNVTIGELLGREQVALDAEAIETLVRGKVVIVTGAGGSIGSEICRQVAGFGPAKLILMDSSEGAVFKVDRKLRQADTEVDVSRCVADVTNGQLVERLFTECQSQLVFHAAAYKHVPLMEEQPSAAALNNVFGTKVVADAAAAHKAQFVLISTDKAANPSCVMGMTKRVAELYVTALARERAAELLTVRFGNVLGSSGSVLPIFREQIEGGGPVTVTHPEMVRYFMTIPEAVGLVLQAASSGLSGKILVLDMGEQVKIVDFAKELIALSGLREPEDIQIVFTGIRPGEKLREELFGRDEELVPGPHQKINVAKGPSPDLTDLLPRLERLHEAAGRGDDASVRSQLEEMTGARQSADGSSAGSAVG